MITDLEFLPLVISSLKIFKRIFSWLKRNMNGVAKQDCRILKILRYYFKDYEPGTPHPPFILEMIEHIQTQKRLSWSRTPGYSSAADRAEIETGDDVDDGYFTSVSIEEEGEEYEKYHEDIHEYRRQEYYEDDHEYDDEEDYGYYEVYRPLFTVAMDACFYPIRL